MVDWKGRFSNMFANLKGDLKPQVYRKGKIQRVGFGDYLNMRRRQLVLGTTPRYVKRRIVTQKRRVQMLLPMIPNQALPGAETAGEKNKVKGYPTRGRPRGTLDPRYAKYGGVFGYRKYVSQQKKLMKQQMFQQAQQMKMQQAPYEYQDYQPEMQMQQQMPQQPQQIPQQYPVEPQKRPIGTVFKGSGGSPYPPVSDRPLAPSRDTIPYGYVEDVDAFTGRRFLKKLPNKERWSG